MNLYKKQISTFFILLFLGLMNLNAQDLKTPDAIQKLIWRSTLNYIVEENPAIKDTTTHDKLENDYYILRKAGEPATLKRYSDNYDEKTLKLLLLADNTYAKGKKAKARKLYDKLLKTMPNDAKIMTKIGLTYYIEEDLSEAKAWALKAVKANFIHYPAHLLLANIYMKANMREKALEEVTLAHLFNRNDPAILQVLEPIYRINGKEYDELWAYKPEYTIAKTAEREVRVGYTIEPWKRYAMCKAVWAFEPYYTDKMKFVDDDLKLLEEKEALLNLIIAYERMEETKVKRKFTLGAILKRTWDEKLIDEFITYEIFMVQNPKSALYFNQNQINDIAKYLFEVRSINMN